MARKKNNPPAATAAAAAVQKPAAEDEPEVQKCKHIHSFLRLSNLRNVAPHLKFTNCTTCDTLTNPNDTKKSLKKPTTPQQQEDPKVDAQPAAPAQAAPMEIWDQEITPADPQAAGDAASAAGPTGDDQQRKASDSSAPDQQIAPPQDKAPAAENQDLSESIWICLCCGFQACGRTVAGHAQEHFAATRHSLSYQVITKKCWCYACDDFVPLESDSGLEAAQMVLAQFAKKKLKTLQTALPPTPLENFLSKAETRTRNVKAAKKGKGDTFAYDPKTELDSKMSIMNLEPIEGLETDERKRAIVPSVHGLHNLGNTCFFNSVIQAMTHTVALQEHFFKEPASALEVLLAVEPALKKDLAAKDKEEHALLQGPLTASLIDLFKSMWESSSKTLSPSRVLGEIRKKAPSFRGGQQHDSQELLRYLVDGMRMEEIKIMELPLKEVFSEDAQKAKLDEILRKLPTFVDSIYGGKLASRVRCHACKTISGVVEPFFDLSLPIPPEETVQIRHTKKPVASVPTPAAPLSRKQQKKLEKEKKSKKIQEKHGNPKPSPQASEPDAKGKVDAPGDEDEAKKGEDQEQEQEGEKEEEQEQEQEDQEEEGEGEEEEDVVSTPIPRDDVEWNKTMGQAYVPKLGECSVESCLAAFCAKEELTGTNKFGCATCFERLSPEEKTKLKESKAKGIDKNKVYTDATKQFLLQEAPKVLTIHLKRFEQRGFSMVRISRTVSFGPTLSLPPFCASECPNKAEELLYDLYAVVVHSGTLNSGHYTAYIKATMPNKQRRWFYISDSTVAPVTEKQVFGCAGAYILFYERRLSA